jgi:hypothetical protein
MAGFPDSTIINLSSPTGSGVRLSLLIVSFLAPPSFGFRLFRAPIYSALVPQGAPALFAGTQRRLLDGGNPNVSADIAVSHLLHPPAHGEDNTFI